MVDQGQEFIVLESLLGLEIQTDVLFWLFFSGLIARKMKKRVNRQQLLFFEKSLTQLCQFEFLNESKTQYGPYSRLNVGYYFKAN